MNIVALCVLIVFPGFFTDHYDHPIFEEGKQLVDMVYLKKELWFFLGILFVVYSVSEECKVTETGISRKNLFHKSVISIAVLMSGVDLWVIPHFFAIWCTCVSRGIISSDGEKLSQIPKSTVLSCRIIQRKNIQIRLQAEFPSGFGIPFISIKRFCIRWTRVCPDVDFNADSKDPNFW